MSQISITIPADDKRAQVAAATFFLTLAGKVPELELPDEPAAMFTYEEIAASDVIVGGIPLKGYTPSPVEPVEPVNITADVSPADVFGAAPVEPVEPPNATPPALDAAGLPWDARIHSSSKAILADGTWRKKRGVPTEVLTAVEAELRQVLAIPAAVVPTPPAAVVPTPPATVVPTPPAAVVDHPVPVNFPEFLQAITRRVREGHTTLERILAIVTAQGLPNIQAVGVRGDLIPTLWGAIVADVQ